MAWIESHQELRGHPKLSAVCRTFSAQRPEMIGHLHLLWWWCMDYAMDGDLSRYTEQQIADAAEWPGDACVFTDGMLSAGFLERTSKGLAIHDWFDFCGELIHKRLRRKEVKRQTSASIVSHIAPKIAESAPTVPNQTLPNQTIKDMRIGLPLRAFDQIWERYPKKKGRIAAEKHFRKSVKSTQDWLDIQNALENYIREIRKNGTDEQFIKNGSTWFYNWRDDVNYKGVQLPRPPAPKPKPPEPPPRENTHEELLEMHQQTIDVLKRCTTGIGCPMCAELEARKLTHV